MIFQNSFVFTRNLSRGTGMIKKPMRYSPSRYLIKKKLEILWFQQKENDLVLNFSKPRLGFRVLF